MPFSKAAKAKTNKRMTYGVILRVTINGQPAPKWFNDYPKGVDSKSMAIERDTIFCRKMKI